MDHSNRHEIEFVLLFAACAVARELADLVPVYALEPLLGRYRVIDPHELAAGAFARGASVFRTPRAEYTGLAIRRRDMQGALTHFRRAGTRFPR